MSKSRCRSFWWNEYSNALPSPTRSAVFALPGGPTGFEDLFCEISSNLVVVIMFLWVFYSVFLKSDCITKSPAAVHFLRNSSMVLAWKSPGWKGFLGPSQNTSFRSFGSRLHEPWALVKCSMKNGLHGLHGYIFLVTFLSTSIPVSDPPVSIAVSRSIAGLKARKVHPDHLSLSRFRRCWWMIVNISQPNFWRPIAFTNANHCLIDLQFFRACLGKARLETQALRRAASRASVRFSDCLLRIAWAT